LSSGDLTRLNSAVVQAFIARNSNRAPCILSAWPYIKFTEKGVRVNDIDFSFIAAILGN
jgi:hypothetical protein